MRKITVDNGVRYNPKSEQTTEIQQNVIKNISPPRKQKEKISQNKEKFLKYLVGEGFGFHKWNN